MISFLFIIFSVLFFDFYLLFIVDNVYLKNNHIFTIRFKKKPIYFRKFKYYVLIICNVFYNVNSFLHLSFIFVSFDRNLKNIFVNNFLCFNVSNSHFPIPSIFEGRSPTLRAAATPPCGALPSCGVRILSGAFML